MHDGTVATRSFVQATEVWVPTADFAHLKLAHGQYGQLLDLAGASHALTFAKGEGLPGQAWDMAQPVIFKTLDQASFLRQEIARKLHLTCGVAIPFFSRDELTGVFVMLCREDENHVGALEVWHTPPNQYEMGLLDGHFGIASKFEFQSKYVKFPKGQGLPGQVWNSKRPVIMNDLGSTKRFLRRDSAQAAGITRGLGFPVGKIDTSNYVFTILSALATPICGRFEAWSVDPGTGKFTFDGGICESGADLKAIYASDEAAKIVGSVMAESVQSQAPVISTKIAQNPAYSSFDSVSILPIIVGGEVTSLVNLYF